jgi:transposase-like protein
LNHACHTDNEPSPLPCFIKEKGAKNLDDFNAFMREISKDAVGRLREEDMTDHLGFEKYDQKAKTIDNSRNGYTPRR